MVLTVLKKISKEEINKIMYKLVISGGDSFTFGAELSSNSKSFKPHKKSWANIVANKIGLKHVNVAHSGRSNSYIARHVINQINDAITNNINPADIFVQVMWTFTNRCEFALAMPIPEYDSPWLGITPYTHIDETKSNWFRKLTKNTKNWTGVYNDLKNSYTRYQELGIVDFASQYQKIVQTATLHNTYSSLREILLLQNILELQQIRYVFSYVNQDVMIGLFNDDSNNVFTNSLRNFIKKEDWYSFPGDFQEYVGFDDWAKENKYKYATSHPLELAHADAAALMHQHIQNRGYNKTILE
jgi:hypothetical protein